MKGMQGSFLSSIIFSILACDGDVVDSKGTNAAPTVLISSHAEGESFANGEVVTFRAVATDDDNEISDLTMAWYIGETTVCEQDLLDANGEQECTVEIVEGMASIVAEVRDPSDAAGRFELAFSIDTNQEPQAEIVEPIENSVFYANQSIVLEGLVSDFEDSAGDLHVEWRSTIDGVLGTVGASTNGTTKC